MTENLASQRVIITGGHSGIGLAMARAFPAIRTSDAIEVAEQAWNAEIAIHLTSAFLTTMAVTPHLTRPGGCIITISSIAAYTGGSRAVQSCSDREMRAVSSGQILLPLEATSLLQRRT